MTGFESFVGVNPWTALFTFCNMLITFAVLKKFLFKPVKKMIDDRQQEIDTMYADADAAKQKAADLEKEYADHVIEHRHAFFNEHLTAAWPLLQVTAQHDRCYAKQQHDNKRRDRRLCDADAAEQRDGKVDFRTIHGVESPSFVFCAAWESGRKKSMSLMQNCAKSSGRMAASGSHSSARNSRI